MKMTEKTAEVLETLVDMVDGFCFNEEHCEECPVNILCYKICDEEVVRDECAEIWNHIELIKETEQIGK